LWPARIVSTARAMARWPRRHHLGVEIGQVGEVEALHGLYLREVGQAHEHGLPPGCLLGELMGEHLV